MKLLDFKADPQLNQLRLKLGTDKYGHFELFDPLLHLSWQEKKFLKVSWLNIVSTKLHACSDHTLAYKNSDVYAVTEQQFHFSMCDKLKELIGQGRLQDIDVTLNEALLTNKEVCEYCLHAVAYQGYDVYRRRHEEYNKGIIKRFKFSHYLQEKHSK